MKNIFKLFVIGTLVLFCINDINAQNQGLPNNPSNLPPTFSRIAETTAKENAQ